MRSAYNLKLWVCVACLASAIAAPAFQQYQPIQMDIIDLAAISRMTPQQLEVLAEGLAAQEMMRTKRSSAQALTSAVSKASSGLGSKVGLLGQASAGAVSFVASASSKSGHDEHGYNYEPHEPKVDYWGLKKSILYTLFQAVKAITGGVTILKGQLIKGGGALAATLGKVISSKGDVVSNFGKKIVSSAALSHKPHSTAVYGPPPPTHIEYPPSAYGAPTAPAQYIAPSAPTGFAAHKYPAHLDGRNKLNGVHAGLVILTPLAEQSSPDVHHVPSGGHTPLEPPNSILHSAFSAIKSAFSAVVPSPSSTSYSSDIHDHPPPPPQPVPPFRPMAWGAVNSYGEPATADTFPDYDPRNQHTMYDYATAKKSTAPKLHQGLTPEKLHKISKNLDKLAHLQLQRSSEELPRYDGLDVYRQMLEQGAKIPLLPTPVMTDAEIGVLSADLLSSEPPSSTTTTTTSTTTTTTTAPPPTDEKSRRKKDVKYLLRGNKIVIV